MKHSKCTECQGTGKIPLVGYRDNAAEPEKLEPKKPRKPMNFTILRKGVPWVLLVGGFGAICIFGPPACDRMNAHDAASRRVFEYEDHKSGEILVEYDPRDGRPVKCFVQVGRTYITGNPTRSITIADRHNDAFINEEVKLLDWEDGNKCFRFHYSFDNK